MDRFQGGRSGRRQLERDQWLDLLVRSIGLEPSEFDSRRKLLFVTRLIPMAERNYNLIELGPWGTGKSFVYRETSPNAILISGGKTTVPQLFVNMGTGRVGLVGTWDVVAFDEVAGMQFSDSTVIQILKDYMESGSFARGKEEIPAEASIVLLGNTSKPPQELARAGHLFADLPKAMIDPAFLDRLHYYLPGWETPKMEQRFFTGHFGFVSDYLAEALRELRKRSYVSAIDDEFALGSHLSARDEKAVRKTVSGLLKLLHPHEEWTRADLREYLELALEGRRRVKEQLRKLAVHEYAKTAFSYVEHANSIETWVDVPERPDEIYIEGVAEPSKVESTPAEPKWVTIEALLVDGESDRVEFKSSARWHYYAKRVDEGIEFEVVKAVAGFMNARGGTLLLGIDDSRQPVGLERDFESVKPRARDGFENWLTTRLERAIGKPALDRVTVSWAQIDGKDVCRLDVVRSSEPVFVAAENGQAADLYVRTNNSTRLFNTEEALRYIRSHWSPRA